MKHNMEEFTKNLSKLFLVLIAASAFQPQLWGNPDNSNDYLQFKIKFSKNSYKINEEILCLLSLTNKSKKRIAVKTRMAVNRGNEPHDVAFKVYDPTGKLLPLIPDITCPIILRPGNYKTIEPGRRVIKFCQIEYLFEFKKVGKYRIQAEYVNWISPEYTKLWEGKLESNIAEIWLRE